MGGTRDTTRSATRFRSHLLLDVLFLLLHGARLRARATLPEGRAPRPVDRRASRPRASERVPFLDRAVDDFDLLASD
jgi:hypothetical protein